MPSDRRSRRPDYDLGAPAGAARGLAARWRVPARVLEIVDGAVATITGFPDAAVFAAFGLPVRRPAGRPSR
jgi:hypothetical protein